MTQYLVSSNDVVHDLVRIDHRESHATAECGYEGEPVELDDVDDADKCGTCFDVEDDSEDDSSNDGGE